MPKAFNISGNNYIQGGALVHVNRQFDDGTFEGWRFIGNCTSFELTKNPTVLKHKSSTQAIQRTDFAMTSGIEEMISFTVDNFSLINWAMHSYGEVQKITEGLATGLSDTIVNPFFNRGYTIGQSPSKPFGDRDISFVDANKPVLKQGGVALVQGLDYEFSRNNRVFFRDRGGVFVEGSPVTITYAKLGDSYQLTKAGDSAFTCQVAFDPVNAAGYEISHVFQSVFLSPNAATQLISTEFRTMQFQGEILNGGEGFPSYYSRTTSKIPFNAIS